MVRAVACRQERVDQRAGIFARSVGHELAGAFDDDDLRVDFPEKAYGVAIGLVAFRIGESKPLARRGEGLAQQAHGQDVAAQLLAVK